MDVTIDGSYTLAETESAIQQKEAFGWVLTSLSKGSGAHVGGVETTSNFASFDRVDAVPKLIELQSPAAGQSAAQLIADRLARGWTLVTFATVYVQNKDGQVGAFRKL
jgi:hypothetical protein